MATGNPRWPEPGTILGSYEIIRPIGRGGMASVHEGRNLRLRKRVAIKVVHAQHVADPSACERFLREGRAASKVHHPHVVQVFELSEHEGIPYLVMELLEGEDLAAHLRARGSIPIGELLTFFLPALAGVGAAHDAGVIHRDLKPANVFLARGGRGVVTPKILDFGISKQLGATAEADLTSTEMLLGTPHYMSPEQTRSAKLVDARSDQYALGVMLYECVTGRKPFTGESSYVLMSAILEAPIARPSSLVAGVPAALDDVILRAMARDPGERFPSVAALGRALLPFAVERVAERWTHELDISPAETGATVGTKSSAEARDPSIMGTTLEDRATNPTQARRRVSAGTVLALAAVGGVIALLSATRPSPATSPTQRHAPPAAVVTEMATASPVEASTESRHPADAAPPEEAATAAKRAPSRSIGESRAPARQAASARPPATLSSVADAAAASPIGANGAPIIFD
jgi:serine/threonine protein kinase